jgi:acetyltransferase
MQPRTSPPSRIDPAHDVLHYQPHTLDPIFSPRSVAVIGATEKEGSVGRTILWNLIRSPFGGTVFPVNPKRSNVLGIKAYPTITDIPDTIDLAVLVTPAPTIPDLVGQCVDAGVKGAIVISAGFKEIGPQGAELERRIMEQANRVKMRIIGPNCLGVMNPITGMNATFAADMARPGNLGFISQSGALLTSILDWSLQENVGFSAIVSLGSMLDVDWGDLIDYLGNDPNTRSIVIYMETIGDARSFLSAAREVALTKPIIVIKPGRTEGAARAAASHTGSLTGSDEVLEAAFRRCGVLRVNTIGELFSMAEVLAKQPLPRGPRLTILTNAGGPGVLSTDALISNGGELAVLPEKTIEDLNNILPGAWSHNNPVDILGDADPIRYAKSLELLADNPVSDGTLVILTPQAMTDPTATAEALKAYANMYDKPLLASWMGGKDVSDGTRILNTTTIPTFNYPDTAARAFMYMWRNNYNLKGIYETPAESDDAGFLSDREIATAVIDRVRNSGRTILSEFESKQLLTAYGIPTTPTHIASNPDEAAQKASEIGFPVVIKLHSVTITHKTDVGGIKLNLQTQDEVRAAFNSIHASVLKKAGEGNFLGVTVQPMVKLEGYELIVGSSLDPQFGPILLFGTGGQLVEIYKDRSLALPPLNTTLARRMMEQTRIYKALLGVRGREAVDIEALDKLLVRFSRLVVEQHWIREIDINPLLASPQGLLALDARVIVYPMDQMESTLPRLAIRPYPIKYIQPWTMKNGERVIIRPIRPEDEPLMRRFHEGLSEQSVTMRYLVPVELGERVTHERLARICFNDYDREIALVVDRQEPRDDNHTILAVARLSRLLDANQARFTMLVSDGWQGQGIGLELMQRLIVICRQEKIIHLTCTFATSNGAMTKLCTRLGFCLSEKQDGLTDASLQIDVA